MAINPESQYPGKIAPATADYPYGQARNITVPGDGTGTPWEAALVNDLFGFQQAVLSEAAIVPSGTPEKATNSQYLRALLAIFGARLTTSETIFTKDLTAVGTVLTGGYSSFGDGGAATWKATGVTTPGSAGTVDASTATIYDANGKEFYLEMPGGVLNVNQLGLFADTPVDGVLVTDYTSLWLDIVDTLRPPKIYLPKRDGYSYRLQLFKVKADSEVFGDSNSLTLGTVVEVFYTGSYSVVMAQINSDSYLRDIRVKSIETNLNNQRATCSTASNVKLERAIFTGFRDTAAPTDAWGMYISEANNINLTQCGFDENTQSDIAFVGNVKGATVDGCYGLGSTFHVNFEPNSSTEFNENVTLKNMKMSKLAILENGSGGTANRAISVNACEIDVLKYDGGQVTLQDCQITDFENESLPFFGELKLVNTLALGPNLLEDPYMINVGFSSAQAATDGNAWYMNSRSGAIGGDQLDPLEEDGVRFVRINPNELLGAVNFAPLNPIPVVAGEYYLIAITGRLFSGTDGAFFSFFNGATDIECRAFRQSNEGANHWTTEMLIVPAGATGNLTVKVGTWTTTVSSFDIHSITVHKVLGKGGGEDVILNQYHGNIYGPRELLPVTAVPTFSDANVRGVLPGDRISLVGNGAQYYWDGAAWQAM